MPKKFFSAKYWTLRDDHFIPEEYKGSHTNVIFTKRGMLEIAQYYREKYDIEIFVFRSMTDVAPEEIKHILDKANTSVINRIGLIWWDHDTYHARPMIYEKNNLFLLDSLAEISDNSFASRTFRDYLITLIPGIKIWACQSKRQVDISSCTTDALIILKDGLRLPFLDIIKNQKFIEKEHGVNQFLMPEELLKSAQISSIINHSQANLNKEILTGKHNKHITLESFRNKYNIPTITHKTIKVANKPSSGQFNFLNWLNDLFREKDEYQKMTIAKKVNFGSFTLHKGIKYMKLIENRWAIRNKLLTQVKDAFEHLSERLSPFIDENDEESMRLTRIAPKKFLVKKLSKNHLSYPLYEKILNEAHRLKSRLNIYIRLITYDGNTLVDHRHIMDDLELYRSIIDKIPNLNSEQKSKITPSF